MHGYLKGKIAVVTGSGNGIGRATAIRLAQEGAQVAVLDREAEALAETAALIKDAGGMALPIVLNLTDETEIVEAFGQIKAKLGPIDVLANNVGGAARERSSEFYKSSSEVWDFVLTLSLKAAMLCSRQVAADMRERRYGKIINTASDSAFLGDRMMTEYVAAKAGVIGFTRSLANELAPFGVNVNAVAPGATATRALAWQTPEQRAAMESKIPMGRLADPSDIANVINFLATDQSAYITGQVIVANGGRLFH